MSRATAVTVCSLELDEGVRRIRVWAWVSAWTPFHQQLALEHAKYLRREGKQAVWIDRVDAPAVDGVRALDYVTFAEQRRKAARREEHRPAPPRCAEEPPREAAPEYVHSDDPAARLAPAIGVHVAGELLDDDQYCTRCGALLACRHLAGRPTFVPGGGYPVGALIERGRGWQALSLSATAATCRQVLEAVS